ncbi:type 1 glutamine amidotransferase [Fertoebacter nigrum]|uniref:Type 1 glutamine amidotransferase n=1 Tax=Fertoeibacter niger TaxID=2656921 RepID=A0A8X8KMT5_9RHOB|nr:type 1 glutamine amidotransferase [Fertoeibacter niger]NUB43056.1 type 1 glutamine amidotransferase [Fertoeibacter niger]
MRVALVENMAQTAQGLVGQALREAGAEVVLHRPWAGEALPADADALVVFGGEQNARDDARHPYLPGLAALMRQMTEAGRPVLGICLGAQLLARAFGAENQIGTAREFGWTDVPLTDAGRADPVLAAAGPVVTAFQWHSDHFTLPPGAVRLAGTALAANQAFRIGAKTYGTQFHFEADRAVVAHWTRDFPQATEAMQPGWTSAHPLLADRHGPRADAAGLAIARAWVALI